MKLEFIQPKKELKPFISKIWLFENNTGLLDHGTLIAPNAKAKIIIPYINALTTTDHKKTATCKEGDVCFIGTRDVPVTLGTPKGATGSIGIELTTSGAYRFLKAPMNHLTNNLFSFSDLYGREGADMLNSLQDAPDPKIKTRLVQEFLFNQLMGNKRNNLVINYSVDLISSSYGLATIKQLEQKTGYSKRYLDMLFKEHLGISPKTFATITRFQRFYKFSAGIPNINSANFYDLYYDQSHFIKEFKRYTGQTPLQYSKFNNDFGRHF